MTRSASAVDESFVIRSVISCEAGDFSGVQNHFKNQENLSELRQSISSECLLEIFDSNIPFVERMTIQIMMEGLGHVIAYSNNNERGRVLYEILNNGIDVNLDKVNIDDFVGGVRSIFLTNLNQNIEFENSAIAYFLSDLDVNIEKYGISREMIYRFKKIKNMSLSDLQPYCDDTCAQKSRRICTIDDEISAKYAFLSIGELNFREFFSCGDLTIDKISFLRVSGILDRKCGNSGQLRNAYVGNNDIFDDCFKYISYLGNGNYLSSYDLMLFRANLDIIRGKIDEEVYLRILKIK